MTDHSPDHAERAAIDRPIWAVALDGFAECYVEADTKVSARWRAASACHEAGYGTSPVDLLSRGCSVYPSTRLEADLFASQTLVAPRALRASLHDTVRGEGDLTAAGQSATGDDR